MLTLQQLVDEINSLIIPNGVLTPEAALGTYKNYVAMFRNEFNEVPNFDIDDYGRIILLRPEMLG